ncbi:FtsH protease activity modulator HflK [Glaciimonas soli]|uniref:Protein HflK n=1 Tax=Glaciimonas soli TaxID=2590999 RepID=A0A843YK21_9BURK|nr:FtsH protease activity modulator HflK [Glaciimonas soli]MQQ99319.1 FtsH protease activity modulator HflK [Glaciimonas soli]
MLGSLLKKFGVKLSLNDPQWGRNSQNDNQQNNDGKKPNNGNGPPDLDKLWQDFNQRLNRFLGGKKNGGGGDSNGGGNFSSGKGAGIGAGMIAAIALFMWLISGFFTVQEGQTAVVSTFGKYSSSTGPGFNWTFPYPIQSHQIVNVSGVRTIEVGYRGNAKNKQPREALMLTDDENIIDIQFAVQYKLKSAADWIFNNKDPEETVREVAETAVREIVGKSKMDYVLYEGREKVALDVGQLMQQILDRYKSGVQITNVTMQGVQPPEQVQAAFDDAVKAGQDRERQKNEGQAYANDVVPKARGAASRLMEEAEAYSARVTANAEGDASRFKQVLTQYQKAPAVTRDRMYLDTMQQIFANTTKVMVDAKNGNNLLYLPLDKLLQQTSGSGTIVPADQNASSGATASSPTAATQSGTTKDADTQAVIDSRARDTRDREGR